MEDSDEDDDEEDKDSDDYDDEKAYTLAIIVNTDYSYNEVAEQWRINSESLQKLNATLSAEERPATNRIIMDEIPRKTHEYCPGFNFSSIDEVSGRT